MVTFVSLSSEYPLDKASSIPKPIFKSIAWQGLTDLRLLLLRKGLVNEAVALFKVERSRLPVEDRADATQSVIDHIKKHNMLPEKQLLWISAELRIYMAQSLYERRDPVSGEAEFLRAKELLTDWCNISGNQDIEALSPYLDIKMFELRLLAYEDPSTYFNESVSLLEKMKTRRHTLTVVCFGHATSAAEALAKQGELDPYRARFLRLHHERELYQKTVQEDMRRLLFDQLQLFNAVNRGVWDVAKALEWLDDFMENNPNFNLPAELISLHRCRRLAWGRLGNSEKERDEKKILEKLEENEPSQYGVLVGIRKSESVVPEMKFDTADLKVMLGFPIDIKDDNWLGEWVGVAGDSKATKQKAMKLMLEWILNDLKTGDIRHNDVKILLSLQDQSKDDKHLFEVLTAIAPDTIYEHLYFQPDNTETFAKAEVWEARFETLKAWLEKSLISSRNSRQYLLAVLQLIRKEVVCSSIAPLDLQISEVKRCFNMVDALPPKVKEFVSLKIPEWHGNIADCCILFAVRSKNFDSADVIEALDRAEQECKKAIELGDQKGDVVDANMRRRAAAEIFILKTHWLIRRPGKSILDPDLREIRENCLRYLEEADKYFSSRHQQSSLHYNLEDLEARERANLVGNTWNIPQKAMQILHAGDVEPDDDTRTQMWNWVQRSKARSLALTMGITGIVPSTILHSISSVEKCRLMYEKMVNLQNRISISEPQQRFWLRQELEAHLMEMRKEEQLQEFCNLRDGKPLRLSELDRITSSAGCTVVLVDWFHVPGTMHDGNLLLLMARAGSVPLVKKLDITIEEVEDWVELYLDSPDAQYRVQQGQARIVTSGLNSLIQPLTLYTKPGDVVVFCPTMKLNRIPLHAIPIEGTDDDASWKPLIYRNPIVYSHSHSLLRLCLWNSQIASEIQGSLKPLILNGIRLDSETQHYREGRESVEKLAHDLGSTALLDDRATKSAFITSSPPSRLIHIHSHVHWDIGDPLAHKIYFADSDSPSDPLETPNGELTAREIFALTLTKGSHVSLIACSGGLTQGNERDEVFGLVPAFLRSGASSTISTLWKIPDQAGAKFTEAFYRALQSEEKLRKESALLPSSAGGGGGTFVDLALCFQRAVVERDGDERDTKLHWSSFVLHGFWMMYMPGITD